jgi:hypothetical protein
MKKLIMIMGTGVILCLVFSFQTVMSAEIIENNEIYMKTPGIFSPVTSYTKSRTYSTNADFDEGILAGIEHDTIPDQLQLSERRIYPFIWIPNVEGSVSKIDIESGAEIARYITSPFPRDESGFPSAIAVDLEGNCWVGNIEAGSVIKIGLLENGAWIDRNGDGICQTSVDIDGDGEILEDEMRPWGEDECVLLEIVFNDDFKGVYVPGQYTGTYSRGMYSAAAPRSMVVDKSNNLWIKPFAGNKFFYIDGKSGECLRVEICSLNYFGSVGLVIDNQGIIYSAGYTSNFLVRMDPSPMPAEFRYYNLGHSVYGMALDYDNHLFIGGYDDPWIARYNILTMTKEKEYNLANNLLPRGMVCTKNNELWVAMRYYNRLVRLSKDLSILNMFAVGADPYGVSMDANGKIWSCNYGDEGIAMINPESNLIELNRTLVNSMGHFCLSDMTGSGARDIPLRIGTWTALYDSEGENTPWGTLLWDTDETDTANITVRVRSSSDQMTWSNWEICTSSEPLLTTPNGRYLQIEVKFISDTEAISPILFELTVETGEITGIQSMKIDVDPGDPRNTVNPKSRGVIKVAIIDDGTFDLHQIDFTQVYFGPNKAQPIRWQFLEKPHKCGHHHHHHHYELIITFDMKDTGIQKGDKTVDLTATLMDGTQLLGTDSIRTVPMPHHGYLCDK